MELLLEAQQLGLLGPGPVARHVDHAAAFEAAWTKPPARALDLGSGGGLPGLVLARGAPETAWTFLDASQRAANFLVGATDRLGLQAEVLCERAEITGRAPGYRGAFDVVVARSFGPPAVTVECGSPFLQVGGHLVVSEPPAGTASARWDELALAELGLELGPEHASDAGRVRVLVQRGPCPDRYPRRVGVPAKRPLF